MLIKQNKKIYVYYTLDAMQHCISFIIHQCPIYLRAVAVRSIALLNLFTKLNLSNFYKPSNVFFFYFTTTQSNLKYLSIQ